MAVINRASTLPLMRFRCVPSTRVDTAIRASSWTPPEPAVLWNILSRDAITTSEICRASRCCTLRRTFFNTGNHKKSISTVESSKARAGFTAQVRGHTCRVAHRSDCRSLNWILSEVLWM